MNSTATITTPPPKGALSPERQRLAEAIDNLRAAEAELAAMLLADSRAADMAFDAGQALIAAEAALADAAVARMDEAVRALASPDGDQNHPIAHGPSMAARLAHSEAVEAVARAAAVREAVARELDQLRRFTVPSRAGSVASAVLAVAEATEQRFEAMAKAQRESWSVIRDRITAYKRQLHVNANAEAPL